MTCTFFGHRDTPDSIKPVLQKLIINLIEEKNVRTFLIGNQGNFDFIVRKLLIELQKTYDIDFSIVLAYLPSQDIQFTENTLYPEGLETVPKKFAISHRNKWLIENSDYVVCYITNSYGGAYQAKCNAEKKGKIVINIATEVNS